MEQSIGRIPLLPLSSNHHSCFLSNDVHTLKVFIFGASGTNKSVAELTYAWQKYIKYTFLCFIINKPVAW